MVFIFSAKSMSNPKNEAMGRSRTLKMEARGAQNGPPSRQKDDRELQDEPQERQGRPSECSNGCPRGPWQPNLLLQVLPKANLSVPGSLRDGFGRSRGPYLRGSNINFEQTISFHPIPCTPFQSIPFHSIPFRSIPFHSMPFHSNSIPHHSIPFHSIPFHCVPFHSIAISLHAVLGFQASAIL